MTENSNSKPIRTPQDEVIIDGVDISGCEYCLKMTKYRCTIQRDVYKCLCEENPNCYYKQLKRKEQECDELKHKVELMMDCASCKIDEYKQTLIEIKEIAMGIMDDDLEDSSTYYDAKQILQIIDEVE